MMNYSINRLNINIRGIASEFYTRIELHFALCLLMYFDQILCLI